MPHFLAHHQEAISKNKDYIIGALGLSDAISVSTEALGLALSKYNENWRICPNYSVSFSKCARHFDVVSSAVTLIVASSDSVLVDFIIDPLKQLQRECGVQIVAIGPPALELLEAGLLVKQVGNMSHLDFKAYIASINNAIGVIPLDDSYFSSCKSAIKYFDYSLAGIPSICSDVSPYSNHIKNWKNGILVSNSNDSWYEAMISLVQSATYRKSIVGEASEYVQNNCSLDHCVRAWQDLFDSLFINEPYRSSVDINGNMSSHFSIPSTKWLLQHLVNPASYKTLLSTVKRFGLTGLYRRILRR